MSTGLCEGLNVKVQGLLLGPHCSLLLHLGAPLWLVVLAHLDGACVCSPCKLTGCWKPFNPAVSLPAGKLRNAVAGSETVLTVSTKEALSPEPALYKDQLPLPFDGTGAIISHLWYQD